MTHPAWAYDLIRHEAAHAVAFLAAGCPRVVIREEGSDHWIADPQWPDDMQPDEFQVMCGQLAGFIIEPSRASAQDKLVHSIIKSKAPDLYARIIEVVEQVVRPAVEGIDEGTLTRWISMIEAGDEVHIRRTRSN